MSPCRIAIVGAGKIARDQHVPAIRDNDAFALAATVDRVGGIDGVPAFPDLDALLAADRAIAAVAICTPPQARAAIAAAVIDAGLHVLLEKPPATTQTEFDTLVAHAARRGVTLFAAWHSQFAPMVPEAVRRLDGNGIAGGRITWREDVRRWHPGQTWLWAPGGLGVFDPGINAFSILSLLANDAPIVRRARLFIPENAHTPIAAALTLAVGGAEITVDLDFRETGEQRWEIDLATTDGHRLRLAEGGCALAVNGGPVERAANREYAGVYARFAALIAAGRSECDATPLRLVADALLVAETVRTAPFVDEAHHQVA